MKPQSMVDILSTALVLFNLAMMCFALYQVMEAGRHIKKVKKSLRLRTINGNLHIVLPDEEDEMIHYHFTNKTCRHVYIHDSKLNVLMLVKKEPGNCI